mmetsp:Transcript_25073/g.72137  ORF Transcript_25073/g.72137 Transcript_25073/m.72137 type:complete len:479 (-) Transcript_25073:249-1685(-)
MYQDDGCGPYGHTGGAHYGGNAYHGGAHHGGGGAHYGGGGAGATYGGTHYTGGGYDHGGPAGGIAPHGGTYYGGGAYSGAHYGDGGGNDLEDSCINGCVAAGCAESTPAVMTYVGPGTGEYVVVTNYKYVGGGAGNLSMVGRKTVYWGRICLALVALVAGIALLSLLWPVLSPTSTTSTTIAQAAMLPATMAPTAPLTTWTPSTTTPKPEPTGECTFWGDPHIRTFDGARPSFYGEGEFYIVKSNKVVIQGRYMGTKYTAGLAATNKIAVGGEFLNGHVIEVGCLEDGDITVDGKPVLQEFPSSFRLGTLGTITYGSEGKLVDEATDHWPKKIVQMHLPLGVHLTVLRWSNYVDLRLIMQRQPDQDGSCGNFDSDPVNDSTEAIFKRVGARVPDKALLFSHSAKVVMSDVEEKLLQLCPESQYMKAEVECPRELTSVHHNRASETLRMSCMLDVCFGSNEHTLQMAKKLGLTDVGVDP